MQVNNKQSFYLYSFIVFAIILVINLIAFNRPMRIDLTDNQIFTLSESTKSVISKIDDNLVVSIYFSNDLPSVLSNNSRFIQDILEEYQARSNGKIRFEFKDPDNDEVAKKDAQALGIQPVQVNVWENDRRETRLIYLALALSYQGRTEAIPVVQNTTGLEYDLTKKIKKLMDTNLTSIGLAKFAGTTQTNQGISQLLSESYQIQDVNMSSVVSDDIGVLIVNGVSDSLSADELQNLKDYINRGGNILLSQSRVNVALNQQMGFFQGVNIESNIFDLISDFGVSIEPNLVLDKQNGQINIPQQVSIFQTWASHDYPFFPTVNSFNMNEAIVSGLEKVQFHFCSEIVIDSMATNVVPIMTSSRNSSVMEGFYNLFPNTNNSPNPMLNNLNQGSKILGVIVDSMMGGQIILLSESNIFADPADQSLARVFAQRQPDNYTFVENSIDYLMGDEELVSLRSREILDRPLSSELDDNSRAWWKWFNIIISPLLIIIMGIIRFRNQKKKSDNVRSIYG